MDTLEEALKRLAKESGNKPPCTVIGIHRTGRAVEVMLDNKADYYSEHIPGEGADIGLYRDRETNKVVGVRLPLTIGRVVFWDEGGSELIVPEPKSKSE